MHTMRWRVPGFLLSLMIVAGAARHACAQVDVAPIPSSLVADHVARLTAWRDELDLTPAQRQAFATWLDDVARGLLEDHAAWDAATAGAPASAHHAFVRRIRQRTDAFAVTLNPVLTDAQRRRAAVVVGRTHAELLRSFPEVAQWCDLRHAIELSRLVQSVDPAFGHDAADAALARAYLEERVIVLAALLDGSAAMLDAVRRRSRAGDEPDVAAREEAERIRPVARAVIAVNERWVDAFAEALEPRYATRFRHRFHRAMAPAFVPVLTTHHHALAACAAELPDPEQRAAVAAMQLRFEPAWNARNEEIMHAASVRRDSFATSLRLVELPSRPVADDVFETIERAQQRRAALESASAAELLALVGAEAIDAARAAAEARTASRRAVTEHDRRIRLADGTTVPLAADLVPAALATAHCAWIERAGVLDETTQHELNVLLARFDAAWARARATYVDEIEALQVHIALRPVTGRDDASELAFASVAETMRSIEVLDEAYRAYDRLWGDLIGDIARTVHPRLATVIGYDLVIIEVRGLSAGDWSHPGARDDLGAPAFVLASEVVGPVVPHATEISLGPPIGAARSLRGTLRTAWSTLVHEYAILNQPASAPPVAFDEMVQVRQARVRAMQPVRTHRRDVARQVTEWAHAFAERLPVTPGETVRAAFAQAAFPTLLAPDETDEQVARLASRDTLSQPQREALAQWWTDDAAERKRVIDGALAITAAIESAPSRADTEALRVAAQAWRRHRADALEAMMREHFAGGAERRR